MKYVLLAYLIAVSVAHAVTVDGFVYLSGQSDHSGSKIVFHAASPSAQTDSTTSTATGAFSINLQPGVYNVDYLHMSYAPYPLPNQALLFATTLPPVTLLQPISGALSGTLGPGDAQVVDSIWVDSAQTLTLLPGTRFFFQPRVRFTVRGLLTAVGAEGDSIVFTKRYASGDSLWGGLRLLSTDGPCHFAFCVIEEANNQYLLDYYGIFGGGLLLEDCEVHASSCTIQRNVNDGGYSSYGGGVACMSGTLVLSDCNILHNYSGNSGHCGGLYCSGNSSLTMTDCYLHGNYASREGGGVLCVDSTSGIVTNCVFDSNAANYGSGLASYTRGSMTITECEFRRNISTTMSVGGAAIVRECIIKDNNGWAMQIYGAPRVENCTMANNTGGVTLYQSNAVFTSNIVANSSEGSGIYFSESQQAQIDYCGIVGNAGGMFSYLYDQSDNAPTAIGIIALTNARGDSCDTYYNIFQDPMFADTARRDYHLTAGSPCIDAGDPALPHDPDGTIADIGAFYYNQLGVDRNFILHPSAFILTAYPNPFNAVTRIAFDLPRAGKVKLSVYDVTGRLAANLVSSPLPAGQHEIRFDGSRLASGVYFARLEAMGAVRTQKLLLLK